MCFLVLDRLLPDPSRNCSYYLYIHYDYLCTCCLYGVGCNNFDAVNIHYKGHWKRRARKIQNRDCFGPIGNIYVHEYQGPPLPVAFPPSAGGGGGGGEEQVYIKYLLCTGGVSYLPPPHESLSTEQFRNQQRYEKCVRYAFGA
jgi:hypothetical protein